MYKLIQKNTFNYYVFIINTPYYVDVFLADVYFVESCGTRIWSPFLVKWNGALQVREEDAHHKHYYSRRLQRGILILALSKGSPLSDLQETYCLIPNAPSLKQKHLLDM